LKLNDFAIAGALFSASQASAAELYEPALPDLSAVMSIFAGGAALDTSGGKTTDGAFDAGSLGC
jgi:galactokinase